MKLGKYFDDSEFTCKCGQHNGLDHVIDKRLVVVLDTMREELNRPLIILSGYRCPEHNAAVGGVPNSQHVVGTAADVYAEGIGVEDLAQLAEKCGADGIGRYYDQGFVHVDVRGYAARWIG